MSWSEAIKLGYSERLKTASCNLVEPLATLRLQVPKGQSLNLAKYAQPISTLLCLNSNPKVILHDQDRSLVLMNPNNLHSLFQMDLETGKMVSEWKLHDDITVNQITPVDKFAQMTPEQTLLGTSHNAIFRIDPRVSGDKLVTNDMKQYTTKNKFSSIVTTEAGKIAIGSEKGDIRLFDKLGKIAKTTLPALGDPIRGIDATKDGRYLVATTKTYLLLIDTQIGIGPNTGKSGFDKSFPADSKPIPRRLQLRPEHVAYMDSSIDFSPAR
jgi:VID27 C-terminal WD40-like domain